MDQRRDATDVGGMSDTSNMRSTVTPLEELQAAHKRLSELRDRHSYQPIERRDGQLIVTLHRTIDAQLSMLNLGIAEQTLLAEQWGEECGEASVVDLLGVVGLARAINGEA